MKHSAEKNEKDPLLLKTAREIIFHFSNWTSSTSPAFYYTELQKVHSFLSWKDPSTWHFWFLIPFSHSLLPLPIVLQSKTQDFHLLSPGGTSAGSTFLEPHVSTVQPGQHSPLALPGLLSDSEGKLQPLVESCRHGCINPLTTLLLKIFLQAQGLCS